MISIIQKRVGGPKRASDLNRAIKLMEWKSFDREVIK